MTVNSNITLMHHRLLNMITVFYGIPISSQEAQDDDLFQLEEDEISIEDLFPDPNDFVPPSPTFTFPPLPPTPPGTEETETVTESTGKTEIEVSQHKQDNLIQFTEKKLHKSERTKSKQKTEKKKSKISTSQHQLSVPTGGSGQITLSLVLALLEWKVKPKTLIESVHLRQCNCKNKMILYISFVSTCFYL